MCSPKGFSGQIPFLVISCYHGNQFTKKFSPCFHLGQNLSSCQVSEKSTDRFDQNDGTDIQTDTQTDRYLLSYIYIYIYIYISRLKFVGTV